MRCYVLVDVKAKTEDDVNKAVVVLTKDGSTATVTKTEGGYRIGVDAPVTDTSKAADVGSLVSASLKSQNGIESAVPVAIVDSSTEPAAGASSLALAAAASLVAVVVAVAL